MQASSIYDLTRVLKDRYFAAHLRIPILLYRRDQSLEILSFEVHIRRDVEGQRVAAALIFDLIPRIYR
jgi:hypothetical protein